MPRKPTGGVTSVNGNWVARITHPDGTRPRYVLGATNEMSEARARNLAELMSQRVRRGEHVHAGKSTASKAGPMATTVEAFGASWASGELHKQHGAANRLKPGPLAPSQRSKLKVYVYPVIGHKAVKDVTEQDIEAVLQAIPPVKSDGTRVLVYGQLRRLFDLAIMPGRLRRDSPVTRYQRPARGASKLFPYLFPDELLALLRCAAVPLGRRVLYALAVYVGLRKSSLYALRWSGFDAAHRALLSRVSKTGIAQYLAIDAGLVWILTRWREHLGSPDPADRIVQCIKLAPAQLPGALRDDLRAAGVTRGALFEHGGAVHRLRFHDLRATFSTWAKRAGWTEGQITDRTGHVSRAMLERYMRAARTLEDLQIAPFPNLEGSIPELEKASEEVGDAKGADEHATDTGCACFMPWRSATSRLQGRRSEPPAELNAWISTGVGGFTRSSEECATA